MDGSSFSDTAASIRRNLLAWFAGVAVILIASAYFFASDYLDRERARYAVDKLAESQALLRSSIANETAGLNKALAAIAGRRDMAQTFQQRDRSRLLAIATPLFQELRDQHQVTHFYFSDPDRINFLRVHAPGRHSDRIDRFTTRRAAETGITTSGIELGVLGTLSLRSVRPWYSEGHLIGYLELGMEISHVLSRIESTVSVITAAAVNRELLEDGSSPRKIEYLGDAIDFSVLRDHALITRQDRMVPSELINGFREAMARPLGEAITVTGNKDFVITSSVLRDAGGNTLGRQLFAQDLTETMIRDRQVRRFAALFLLALAFVGAIPFLVVVRRSELRIERSLTTLRNELDERQLELDTTEHKLKQARRIAKLGTWSYEARTGELWMSEEVQAMLGRDGFVHARGFEALTEHFTETDRNDFLHHVRDSSRTAGAFHFLAHTVRDGQAGRWLQFDCESTLDQRGQPDVTRGTLLDVTGIKELELRQLESESKFRAIFEQNSEGLVFADGEGRITETNGTACDLFEVPAGAMVGSYLTDYFPVEVATEVRRLTSDKLDHRDARHKEAMLKRSGGREFSASITIGAIEELGENRNYLIVTDVSEVRDLEVQLRRSQKMEAIGELAGGIAHDFNNLLGVIVGNIELLEHTDASGEDAASRIAKAKSAALRGSELAHRLLDLSRKDVAATIAVNADAIIDEVVDIIASSLTSRITLRTHFVEETWLCDTDPGALEDALINMALNARDAMPSGGELVIGSRNVSFEIPWTTALGDAVRAGDFVEVSITDSGTGIPRDQWDRVFDPFFSTKDRHKGTGLGLSMVYSFTKRSGGYINIHSEMGVGTSIRLYLPRSSSDTAAEPEVPSDTLQTSEHAETILVVDDETELRHVAEQMLQHLGYRTLSASNADEALQTLAGHPEVDLLFSDVIMPGAKDGFALARLAREMRPELKILLASGNAGRTTDGNGTEDRHRDCSWDQEILAKPYRAAELARRVKELLATAQSLNSPAS